MRRALPPARLAFVAALASTGSVAMYAAAAAAAARTLASDVGPAVFEVKKSRFITYGGRARSTAEATRFAARVAAEHGRADHVCWACVCPDGARSVDDGEPSGTAGRPILSALGDLHESVIAIARFRGGPKLGAGGLVRAYGAAARQLLTEAEAAGMIQPIVLKASVVLAAPARDVGALYAIAGALSPCETVSEEYVANEVRVTFAVGLGLEEELLRRARDATAGCARRVATSDAVGR